MSEYNKYIEHSHGFKFPVVPFLWNYEDYSNPFPSKKVLELTKSKFIDIVKGLNSVLDVQLNMLDESKTKFIVNIQYKRDKYYYDGNHHDIYLGYHTWCYYAETGEQKLDDDTSSLYFYNTSIFQLDNKLCYSSGYPYKGTHKKNKPGGISINKEPERRAASIHKVHNAARFSSINVCNFEIDQDNISFVSIGKYFTNKNKDVLHVDNKTCVAVLHIFRNVPDNDPDNDNFVKLINKYI